MKKLFLTLVIVLLAVSAQAQLKLHQNGQVSLGSLSSSLESGVQFLPTCSYFNSSVSQSWSWVSLSQPKHAKAKSWIVVYPNSDRHVFSVTGEGSVYYGCLLLNKSQDGSLNEERDGHSEKIDAEQAKAIINRISGFYYKPDKTEFPDLEGNKFVEPEAIPELMADHEKRIVGLSSRELCEAFPDAVRSDADGHKCIDYNAVVTVLVEVVKKQDEEIGVLRKTLVEHGLLEPQ